MSIRAGAGARGWTVKQGGDDKMSKEETVFSY